MGSAAPPSKTMSRLRQVLALIVLLVTISVAYTLLRNNNLSRESHDAGSIPSGSSFIGLSEPAQAGFLRAAGPKPMLFPDEHGPHPDYQTEWWYFTGNLASVDGMRFGFQLTFFRRALLPPGTISSRGSVWSSFQVYMAHFAITASEGRQHVVEERLSRGAAGLAGAQAFPFQVWLDDWSVIEISKNQYQLKAANESVALDLILMDQKGPILQGDQGYSQKGPDPGNASYYYSLTRLETNGSLRVGQQSYQVKGNGWMDHEYSTSALSADQAGWDWFSIQLDNNQELMYYQIRNTGGSIDPFSEGTWVYEDGTTQTISKDDISVTKLDSWRSPTSAAIYPMGWQVSIPSIGVELKIVPLFQDQELIVSYTYWEGAVTVEAIYKNKRIYGSGYVELTGYLP